MTSSDEKKLSHFLLDGNYRPNGTHYSSILIQGDIAIAKNHNGTSQALQIKYGEFGEADPETARATGEMFYNMELRTEEGKFMKFGVVSADGKKITMQGNWGISCIEWITEEEAAALEKEGDPIEAPPGPYKIQPENQGKLLWITGPPGLGKSTTAQLLCRTAGYVYYEADCFNNCKNPYIAPDVDNPTLAQGMQKPLVGEGLEDRREACKKATDEFRKMLSGKGFDRKIAEEFYGLMCNDILHERMRIGGDWVIAGVALTQEFREIIRSILGPDLVFIVLSMEKKDVRDRLMTRHKDGEGFVNSLMFINNLCEAATEDEEQAVSVEVSKENTKEEVVAKILEMLD